MKVRPMRGTLWCRKYVPGREQFEVEGLGTVNGTQVGDLVVVSDKTLGSDNTLSKFAVVEAIGHGPISWGVLYLSSTDLRGYSEINWDTDWDEQNIKVGTVICLRACAGIDQRREEDFIQVRYDEICAIGTPIGASPPMLPAPGWILIEPMPLEVRLGMDMFEIVGRARVYALPKGGPQLDIAVGDIVLYPVVGGMEHVEFDNGAIRGLPYGELLAVEVL